MNEPIDPIRRGLLPEELLDRLRQLIIEGALEPGSKVNEAALCERFGVSRTPLRAALRGLAAEGLVVLTPRRGAAIAEFTRADLEQAFPILGALEALAGELACAAVTDAEIARAARLERELAAAHQAGDLKRYSRANAEIHGLILRAAANPTLERMLASLEGRVRRARYIVNMSADRWAEAAAEHREIQAALEARDGPRLGETLRRHIAGKLASILGQLDGRRSG